MAVGQVSQLPEEGQFDSFVARESVRLLKRFGNGDKLFFLISSFSKPHDPFMPAQRLAGMFRPEDMKLPASSWDKDNLTTCLPKCSVPFNTTLPRRN